MRHFHKRSQTGAATVGVICAVILAGASSPTAMASDAAGALADRFAAPPSSPIEHQRVATTPPARSAQEVPPRQAQLSPKDESDRVRSVLDTLRERIEASGPTSTQIQTDSIREPKAEAPTAETRPRSTPSAPTRGLSGNDVFGDETRSAGRQPAPDGVRSHGVRSWASPSMQRHGETIDAAPKRPLGPIERVTVLLIMKPGNRGIRRFHKTADPIVCIAQSCFVSRGPSDTARKMRRRKALGTVNTLGKRAGACKNRRACVFRDVRLEGGKAEIQPIDLRFIRHDRRERTVVEADRTCGIFRGRLTCGRPVESRTYTAWIVPEDVAVEAGVRILEAALRSRLSGPRSAALR